MKAFVIESRKGWVSIPERIAGYDFPLSFHSQISSATPFPFRMAAEKSIKKHKLGRAPYHAHVEEIEWNNF